MASKKSVPGPTPNLSSLPAFDLTFALDDKESPKEVTIFPTTAQGDMTEWISSDIEHAVSLDDIA